ncbi:uncharacterized protein E0L32_006123 [Thyridium curvatum]|uniref:Uncharacterized protein n=1 Tax=Thyridium curvatum TaxID=1093900 RepID=A0A507B0H2_9PEZI|nr:uncharacterized protein E0L32_006123 [Thyridium curvatum]TPX13393.1 hypothetical protein E0L32_006123 [Thyridium curvatum]
MGKYQSKSELPGESGTRSVQSPGNLAVSIPKLDTDCLLQAPDESSIKRSWMQLSNLIDSHVQTFYDAGVSLQNDRESIRKDLRRYRIVEEARELDELAELLYAPVYRKLGLRVCITRVMLSSIDFFGHPRGTSLDRDVVILLNRFRQLRPNPSPEHEAALAHWRMITAFFLAPSSKDLRDDEYPCVNLLVQFLSLFRLIPDDDERAAWTASLVTIAHKSIDVGEKIFAHPSTWKFEWHPEASALPPLEIFMEETSKSRKDTGVPHYDAGPPPIVLFPALIELPIGVGDTETPLNVVQIADLGPGMALFESRVRSLSSLLALENSESCTQARAASVGATSDLRYEGGGAYAYPLRNDRPTIRNASPGLREPEDFIKPIRRTSTMDSVSKHRSSSSRSFGSHYTSSRKKRDSRHTAP